jgi:hypothetical protein
LNTRVKYLSGLACLLLSAVICVAFSLGGNEGFDLAKQQIMLRKIGHEVLLHSGDSTSRVLPVKQVDENEYQITFENEFTFQPDSLIAIIKRSLAQNNLTHNYIVNVMNCSGKDVVFGYAIAGSEKNNIISCSGRKQPKSCYLINVKFEKDGITANQKRYLIGSLPMLAFVGLLVFSQSKTKKQPNIAPNTEILKIGNMLFDADKRCLYFGETMIALTAKESKLLKIFAGAPNSVIERARLQKEIWEDEGVIVGRSLDMFISKLRKKLESDPSVLIINVHGKGYKLEVS